MQIIINPQKDLNKKPCLYCGGLYLESVDFSTIEIYRDEQTGNVGFDSWECLWGYHSAFVDDTMKDEHFKLIQQRARRLIPYSILSANMLLKFGGTSTRTFFMQKNRKCLSDTNKAIARAQDLYYKFGVTKERADQNYTYPEDDTYYIDEEVDFKHETAIHNLLQKMNSLTVSTQHQEQEEQEDEKENLFDNKSTSDCRLIENDSKEDSFVVVKKKKY